jgi:hypothetical protein
LLDAMCALSFLSVLLDPRHVKFFVRVEPNLLYVIFVMLYAQLAAVCSHLSKFQIS